MSSKFKTIQVNCSTYTTWFSWLEKHFIYGAIYNCLIMTMLPFRKMHCTLFCFVVSVWIYTILVFEQETSVRNHRQWSSPIYLLQNFIRFSVICCDVSLRHEGQVCFCHRPPLSPLSSQCTFYVTCLLPACTVQCRHIQIYGKWQTSKGKKWVRFKLARERVLIMQDWITAIDLKKKKT